MRKVTALLLACFCMLGTLYAQRQVTGKVTDAKDGTPLAGVSVKVKGTNIGTSTETDGTFTISVSKPNAKLVFSFVGYTEKEVDAAGNTVTVALSQSTSNDLEEVVVVAYGSQKKQASTGSVSVVKSDMLKERPVTSVEKALQGAAAGVTVQSVSGQPGAASTVRIRGIGSFTASSNPLYVIDGVAVTTGDFTQGSTTANILSTIDPRDIESISVLKDASAASLYGSRAGNGVILINTKKGKTGKTKINVSASNGFSSLAVQKHDVMSTSQYFKYWWDYYYNGRISAGDAPSVAATAANASTISNLAVNPYNNTNPYGAGGVLNSGVKQLYDNDWRDAVTSIGRTQDYSLSLSGGNERTTFYLSGSYFNQEGIVVGSDFKRYSLKLNLENKATDYLKVGVNTSFGFTDQNTPPGAGGAANPIRFADIVSNVYPLYRIDADGNPLVDATGKKIYNYNTPVVFDYNPVGLAENNIYRAQSARALITGFAELSIMPGLKFKSLGGFDFVDLGETQHYNYTNGDGRGVRGRTTKYAPRDIQLTITNTLSYDKTFGNHTLSALVGQEAVRTKYENLIAGATGFPGPGFVELDAAATPTTASSIITEKRLASYLSRINYSFDNKYFVSASFRRDGSSVFGIDSRWGNFWSVGGAWRISQENFMAGIDWLNELKVRGSYGVSGNDNIGRYARLDLYSTGYNYGGGNGAINDQLGNSQLQWEGNKVTDIGVEFTIFKRIKGEFSYFNRGSNAILFNKPLSLLTGFENITTNLADMKNYGFEGLVEIGLMQKKNFDWSVSLNMTTYKNQIQKMSIDSILQGSQRWKVGSDRYQFYLREYAGVDVQTGQPLWYIDGANGKTTTTNWNNATRYENGSALPKFFGGITNKFQFYNFDASVFVFFSVGGKIYDATLASEMDGGNAPGSQLANQSFAAWQKPGDVTNVPRFVPRNTDLGNSASTRFLFDGTYARVKNINIGYSLPSNVIKRLKISNARIYLAAENILTLAKHKGMDPEVEITGIPNNDVPNIKTISFGLNLGL